MSNSKIDEKLYEAAIEGNIAEMKDCLARGANPNARFGDDKHTLIADAKVDVPALKVLIEAGALVNLGNRRGVYPLENRKSNIDEIDQTIYKAAQSIGLKLGIVFKDIEQTLIKAGAIEYLSFYHLVNDIQNVEDMKKLINSGVEILYDDVNDVNTRTASFLTRLLVDQDHGNVYQLRHLTELYIKAGGDINMAYSSGFTALMAARDPQIVQMLLDAGADVNATDEDGKSAVDYILSDLTDDKCSIHYSNNLMKILTLLTEAGSKTTLGNYPLSDDSKTALYQFEIVESPESALAKLKENFAGEHGNRIYYEYDEEFNKFSKIKGWYNEASGYEDRETETVARVIEQDENKFSLYTDGGYILIEKGKEGGSIVTIENCLANAEILQAGGLTYVPDTLKGKYENNYDMPFIDIDDFTKLRGRYLDKLRKHIDTPDSIAEYAKARRAYDAETGVARKLWYDTNFFFKNENPMDDMVSISKVEKVKKEKASDVRIAEKQKQVQQWKTEQAKKPNLNIIKNSIQREY